MIYISIRDEALMLWQKKKEVLKGSYVMDSLKEILGKDVPMMVLKHDNPLLDNPNPESLYIYIQDEDSPMLVEAVFDPFDKKINYYLVSRCSSCREVFTCDEYNGVFFFNDLETLGRALELLMDETPICGRCWHQ